MDWRQRFDAFVSLKTDAARSAVLPPYATELEHRPPAARAIGSAWTRRLFDGDFYLSPSPDPARPACSLVFVQSLDGNTGASDPWMLGGGAMDKHLIYEGLSCVAADGVLTGSTTIEGAAMLLSVWHPVLVDLRASLGKPRHPTQIVATLRGIDVNSTLLCNVPEVPAVIVTSPHGMDRMRASLQSRPWITAIVTEPPGDFASAFAQLRTMGLERISSVGGRHVATALIDAGLVQDLYVTTSPKMGGEPNTPLYPKPWAWPEVLRKRGTGTEAGVIFQHLYVSTSERM